MAFVSSQFHLFVKLRPLLNEVSGASLHAILSIKRNSESLTLTGTRDLAKHRKHFCS